MKVTYPILRRTLEVAINFRKGMSRSKEPEYKVFGKITLWRVDPSDREHVGFSKLPGQCLTKPQSLLEYLDANPENPLCIFKSTGLLPIAE